MIILPSYGRKKVGNPRGNLHFSVGDGAPSHSLRIFNHIQEADTKIYKYRKFKWLLRESNLRPRRWEASAHTTWPLRCTTQHDQCQLWYMSYLCQFATCIMCKTCGLERTQWCLAWSQINLLAFPRGQYCNMVDKTKKHNRQEQTQPITASMTNLMNICIVYGIVLFCWSHTS